jgi:predicted DNA-binding transcriptional regulator YafY
MSAVNQSRRGIVQNMDEAISEAKIIAFNDDGEACVWFGGVMFHVYDAARSWQKVRNFKSSRIAGLREQDGEEALSEARNRMESKGFKVIS